MTVFGVGPEEVVGALLLERHPAAADQVEFDLWWLKLWCGLGTLARVEGHGPVTEAWIRRVPSRS